MKLNELSLGKGLGLIKRKIIQPAHSTRQTGSFRSVPFTKSVSFTQVLGINMYGKQIEFNIVKLMLICVWWEHEQSVKMDQHRRGPQGIEESMAVCALTTKRWSGGQCCESEGNATAPLLIILAPMTAPTYLFPCHCLCKSSRWCSFSLVLFVSLFFA